jgi:mono/diheme cytochrome c family protein
MGVLTYKGATAEEATAAGSEVIDRILADNELPETSRQGLELYFANCSSCHTYAGEGSSNFGAPDLTDIGARQGTNVDFFKRYVSDPSQFGNTVMPKFAALGEENLQAIADFLVASKGGGG